MSLTTDGSGAVESEQKYTAWGVVRATTEAGQSFRVEVREWDGGAAES